MAAAYLVQIRKGKKEKIIIKIKLIHKARDVTKTKWKYHIKSYHFQISTKKITDMIAKYDCANIVITL